MSPVWYISFITIPIFLWGYGMFTGVKRWVFEAFNLRKHGALPTLVVGNLSAGGSGKTPMVLFLIESFGNEKIGVLSRGYGRKTKGFLRVNEDSTYAEVGDEALEIFNYHNQTPVYLCEDRLEGLEQIYIDGKADWVILDDGYQHLGLSANKSVILTPYNRPFWEERFCLPLGNLREFKSAATSADVIVVTKCPLELTKEEAQLYLKDLRLDRSHIFFAHYRQSEPLALHNESNERKAILVTGIAQKDGLDESILGWDIVDYISYADHHEFSERDVHFWLKTCKVKSVNSLVVTRKDLQRIQNNGLISILLEEKISIYEIHIDVEILWNQKDDLLKLIHPC